MIQQTAMQELIDELNKRISDKPANNDIQFGKELGYEFAIDKATELLTKEREQIEQAWKQGYNHRDKQICA